MARVIGTRESLEAEIRVAIDALSQAHRHILALDVAIGRIATLISQASEDRQIDPGVAESIAIVLGSLKAEVKAIDQD